MEHPRYTLIHNENGPDLGTAGAPVLEVDGPTSRTWPAPGSSSPTRTGGWTPRPGRRTWPPG